MGCSSAAASGVQRAGAYCVAKHTACSYCVDVLVSIRDLHQKKKLVSASSSDGLSQRPKRQQSKNNCLRFDQFLTSIVQYLQCIQLLQYVTASWYVERLMQTGVRLSDYIVQDPTLKSYRSREEKMNLNTK